MLTPDFSMEDVPVSVPGVNNYLKPNFHFVNILDLPSYATSISLGVLIINIRNCRKILANLLAISVLLIPILLASY